MGRLWIWPARPTFFSASAALRRRSLLLPPERGHSGCGKTTLLNIVGGLDQYTSGDLTINGRSTREFKDRDWDAYRNHSSSFSIQVPP